MPILGILGLGAAIMVAAFLVLGAGSSASALPLGTNNVKGVASAPVEIQMWGDFQCPPCKAFADSIEKKLAETLIPDGQVRLRFRHMAFLGEESILAAAASECAAEQGAFWPYHDRLYAEQRGKNSGAFSQQNLKRFGAELGLEAASFASCVDEGQAIARVKDETAAGQQQGVNRTPTIFVNGQKIEGVPPWEQLRRLIDTTAMTVPAPAGPGL
ncbi:MAG: DsbA family protein [Chloroflexota bacterium]